MPNSLTIKGTNALWWNGSDSGLSIAKISAPSATMTFEVGSEPMDNGETYSGYLNDRAQAIETNGKWFQYAGGVIEAKLTGPSSADFDLKLERRQSGIWQQVAISETPTSIESISYNAANGYYRLIVLSYSGAGNVH